MSGSKVVVGERKCPINVLPQEAFFTYENHGDSAVGGWGVWHTKQPVPMKCGESDLEEQPHTVPDSPRWG